MQNSEVRQMKKNEALNRIRKIIFSIPSEFSLSHPDEHGESNDNKIWDIEYILKKLDKDLTSLKD